MGRYYGAASTIETQWQPDITVWMARNRDPNGEQPPRLQHAFWSTHLVYQKKVPSHQQDSTVAKYCVGRHGHQANGNGPPTNPPVMPRGPGGGTSLVLGNEGSPQTSDIPYGNPLWDWPYGAVSIHVVQEQLGWGWYVPPRPPLPWTSFWQESNGEWGALPGNLSDEQFANIWHPRRQR